PRSFSTSAAYDVSGGYRARPAFPTRRSSDLLPPVARAAVVRPRVGRAQSLDHPACPARARVVGPTARRGLLTTCRVTGTTRWTLDRKSTRLNSSHVKISYAVFCLKKKRRQCE